MSSAIELTCIQVLDRLRTSLRNYSDLFAITSYPPIINKLWPKCIAYGICILQLYWKSIKWPWVEPFEMNANGQARVHLEPLLQCLRS